MPETELALAILAGIAFLVLLLYLVFGGFHRAFLAVGFTREQASLIVIGSLLGGLINLPLFVVNGWILAINVGGALVPVLVTFLVLRRNPSIAQEILAGGIVVALVTYSITRATPEGIVSYPFAWLLPPLAAAGVSFVSDWRDRQDAAPIAYASGTLGALVGADVFRLPEFLAQDPPMEGAVASLGGASVFDMVFLTGVLAVLLDMLFFRRRVSESPGTTPYREYTVFRSSTSPEEIRDWEIFREPAFRERTAGAVRKEAARREIQRTPSRGPDTVWEILFGR